MKLKIVKDYKNPEDRNIEIVERKGIGHPDTLADKLARNTATFTIDEIATEITEVIKSHRN